MKASFRALSCLLLIALALSACGNKGDLVLPPPEAPAKDAPAEP
jgi:predicted small lipoprotein YifL